MVRNRWYHLATVTAVSFAGAVFVLSAIDTHRATDGTKPTVPSDQSADQPQNGTAEGIRVHGHWTIEVREPDGELVTRREFENALTSPGSSHLVELLARQRTPHKWGVRVDGAGDSRPCLLHGSPSGCNILEDDGVASTLPEAVFKTLTLSVSSSPTPEFVLSGDFTAPKDGAITFVRTLHGYCGPDVSPPDCVADSPITNFVFTQTSISSVAVLSGQSVLVTVRINFAPPA